MRIQVIVEERGPIYWLAVASASHARRGVEAGLCVFGHGERRLHEAPRRGDGVVFYAPREDCRSGRTRQEFVAVGVITHDEVIVDGERCSQRTKWRKRARPVSIRTLLDKLDFTRDLGKRWGSGLRQPTRRISRRDFRKICRAMGVPPPA